MNNSSCLKKRLNKLLLTVLTTQMYIAGYSQQPSESIFYDTITKVSRDGYIRSGFGDGPYLYLSGSSFSEKAPVPTILKTDTAGKTIWTAADYDNYNRYANYQGFADNMASCSGTVKSGNFLYTIVTGYSFMNLPYEVWCLSDSTGTLLWKTKVNEPVIKIADYSSTELLMITNTFAYKFHIIDKATGKITFSKQFGTSGGLGADANIFVDAGKNILLSWDDTCKKFRDNHLSNLLWTSHVPNTGTLTLVHSVMQDSGRYLFLGRNNVRAVDSSTGNTLWAKKISVGFVAGVQSGIDGIPRSFMVKDSVLYVTWASQFVGGGNSRGFTLTRLNTGNGYISYNVSHDFTGVPADPGPSSNGEEDWPFSLNLDNRQQVYITGSYDYSAGPENPGNWGIMKIDGKTGNKIYESTITDDSTSRFVLSKGKMLYFFDNKFYCAGNMQKKGSLLFAKPAIVRFDTADIYKEGYRLYPDYTFRYPSALVALENFGKQKILFLKKTGRSAVLEMKGSGNQLLWSKTFSRQGKFVVPHLLKNISDSVIALSYQTFAENADTKVIIGNADSLCFLKLDSLGNILWQNNIKTNNNDSVKPSFVYSDNQGKTSFFYYSKGGGLAYAHYGYMLNGNATTLSGVGISEYQNFDQLPKIRIPRVQQFGKDTMVFFRSGDPGAGFANLGFLYSTQQTLTGYQSFGTRQIQNFLKVHSCIKLDSVSHLVMGTNINGNPYAARYNYRLATPMVWSNTNTSQGVVLTADTSLTSAWLLSQKPGSILVTRLNRQTGITAWDFEKTANTAQYFIPLNINYNKNFGYITVAGSIIDSSVAGNISSYFNLTLDSSNNIIRNITRTGYGIGETAVAAVVAKENGGTLYGGVVGTAEYGVAGFYVQDCYNANLSAAVSITASSTSICAGSPVTFTASPVNGGSFPVYQWQVNGVNAGSNSNIFTTTSLNNNDKVTVVLTSSLECAFPQMATSNTITMAVTVLPSANAGHDTSVCIGGSVQLNASGGTSYSWSPATGLSNINIPNPVASPVTTTAYIVTVSNGSGSCSSAKDTIIVSVNPFVTPAVSITKLNGSSICFGDPALFSATPVNGGNLPVYQWRVNSINSGPPVSNSNLFTGFSLSNNDQVSVIMTSNASCLTASQAVSNIINLSVQQLAKPQITVNNRVYNVTNPDAAATYTWQQKNNNSWANIIPLATGITYTATAAGEYRVMGVKGPCVLFSDSALTNRVNIPNNPFGIYLFPNPAQTLIRLDSIRISQQWETLKIVNSNGVQVLPVININGQSSITVNITNLSKGSYFAMLRRKDGEFTTIKFVKN